ncbi:MAG TPA: plastocyanin/azurin family copper-binding protein [Baekduia sp.]|uniref:cupredoxin domain-containing protein n=1 Tax=Baekduia sp. TaxID=2600305 RepID=UPI002D787757|nr:plastocyanin/azurin family copper-binding protein [Baekduia sp.]HET6506860.1 plastocyanin/azurin family copper-binding protein [Baekduia sp.]
MIGRKATLMLVGATAFAVAPATLASGATKTTKGKTRKVGVHDNYYAPSKLTVHVGDSVDWTWGDDVEDVHDVSLKSAPKGVKKFHSDPLAAGDDFKRKLTKPGTYKIICTFHEEEMKMTITVKKKP